MNDSPHALADRFYRAFQQRNAAAMGACYADDVQFSDPVFPSLRGEEARAMWRMLCGRSTDLRIEFEVRSASEQVVVTAWTAHYTFVKTGRPVVNRIVATMRCDGGQIVEHTDVFSFWRWSRQALGVPGLLFGWSQPLQQRVQATAARGLAEFRSSRSSTG